jgi:hypothetical protein
MGAVTLPPEKLRPEILQRIQAMDNESLLLPNKLLLALEKNQLWRELSAEAESDRQAGKFDHLSEVIQNVRAQLRRE